MKKLALLLVFAFVFLAACGIAEPVIDETTTEITTETTIEEATTEAPFEYIYLTDAEIREIFWPAASLHVIHTHPSLDIDWDSEAVYFNGRPYRRVLDPRFPNWQAYIDAMHTQFSPALVEEIWARFNNPTYIEHDNALYMIVPDGLGSGPEEVHSVRVVHESLERIVYRLRTVFEDANGEAFTDREFTREYIDGRWVFTQFPSWPV